ncbi:large subunit GTPase [Capsaspora owczarzaki ATCC 30864]|nr:large subunit GTPase [Capsaspora owczarzaki ATCC 30864]|eukprot:XP_004343924.1 large subunit GTPase [Capsaspora owczarzaki ATCC 30864]
MTKGRPSKGSDRLGAAIIRARFKKGAVSRDESGFIHSAELEDGYNWARLQSVTEQGDLDEFLTTAELAGQEFTAEKLNVSVVTEPQHSALLSREEQKIQEMVHKEHSEMLTVPRRPAWDEDTSAEELQTKERESFLEWRRQLAWLQDEKGVIMTPFERNLEVWRQLWRVIERCHIVVQIVDARNPLLFRSSDLEKYVKEIDRTKKNILLVNKADMLTEEQRTQWKQYFEANKITFAFWSANAELSRLAEIAELRKLEETVATMESNLNVSGRASSSSSAAAAAAAPAASSAPAPAAEADDDDDNDQWESEEEEGDDADEAGEDEEWETDEGEEEDEEEEEEEPEPEPEPVPEPEPAPAPAPAHVRIKGAAPSKFPTRVDPRTGVVLSGPTKAAPNHAPAPKPAAPASAASSVLEEPTITPAALRAVRKHLSSIHVFNGPELFLLFRALGSRLVAEDEVLNIGLVGYPNVGKSSSINALMGEKKVAVSATPGKTKHFQTINVSEDLILCDCPGLVFPTFLSTKAEMVCNGMLPIDQLREYVGPTALVAQRIPRRVIESTYGIKLIRPAEGQDPDRPPTAHELLHCYGFNRGFMTAHGSPDEPRSARYILKDYVKGKLLFCHPPPNVDAAEFNRVQSKDIYLEGPVTGSAIKSTKDIASAPVAGPRHNPRYLNQVDEDFFQQSRNVNLVARGTYGGTGVARVSQIPYLNPEGAASLSPRSSDDIKDKKHNNKNRREKTRRVMALQ